mmetsp:Transcript_39743/g.85985  ORF Transcript_39743/g.85985 Transcript_39743/m.85985 type:complete len:215 (-) Transcript_39743:342-986(-)
MIHVSSCSFPATTTLHQSCHGLLWRSSDPRDGFRTSETQQSSAILTNFMHINGGHRASRCQQVSHLLVVNFQHRHLDPPCSLAQSREDPCDGAWCHTTGRASLRADHAIGLARSSLAIGDDRPVVSLGHGIHDGCHSGVVELLLCGLRSKGVITTHTPLTVAIGAFVRRVPQETQQTLVHQRLQSNCLTIDEGCLLFIARLQAHAERYITSATI